MGRGRRLDSSNQTPDMSKVSKAYLQIERMNGYEVDCCLLQAHQTDAASLEAAVFGPCFNLLAAMALCLPNFLPFSRLVMQWQQAAEEAAAKVEQEQLQIQRCLPADGASRV